jgi:hypothetical protein
MQSKLVAQWDGERAVFDTNDIMGFASPEGETRFRASAAPRRAARTAPRWLCGACRPPALCAVGCEVVA